ncbi:hypothetical protein [Hyphococcus sp.]|uniref:hypothetical protein n=1 Tax=Hyphococcus sp. TaxID=2038636 RepID=UPI003CCBDAA1
MLSANGAAMRIVISIAFLITTLACASTDEAVETPPVFAEYAGIYASGPLAVAEISAVDDMLAAVPPFWTSKPYFERSADDTFAMMLPSPAPDRTITFTRNQENRVAGFTLANMEQRSDGKDFERLGAGETPPALLFLNREPHKAARAAIADQSLSADDLAEYALLLLLRHPARHEDSAIFLNAVSEAYPDHAQLKALYGYSLVAINRREDALRVSREALTLDPENRVALEAVRRLTFDEPQAGEGYRKHIPFLLRDAFAPPTREDIQETKAAVSNRDLQAKEVTLVSTHELTLSHATFDVRVISHNVHGSKHFGAVFVPKNAGPGPAPVIIDARGVNPTYSPRDVSTGTTTLRSLGPEQSNFIFLVPDYRGNTLTINDVDYVSEGDPSDAWDGAADDAIAFLNAALSVTPEADPDKIAIVGYSRGGSVALLAGARDKRIDLALNVVGPVDHLSAMDPHLGWTTWEVLADVMREGEIPAPTEEGGQDFDHFIDRVVDDGETLGQVRRRLIASSPLYWLETLPQTHSWYGAEDHAVPVANPQILKQRLRDNGLHPPEYTVTVYEQRGHDTDPYIVQKEIAERLKEWAKTD